MHLSVRLSLFALIATTLLTGCSPTNTPASTPINTTPTGSSPTNTTPPSNSTGAKLDGNVHDGQQSVVGAHVYLFAAGTSGYGGPSTSLLNSNTAGTDSLGSYVLTNANGGFSITGDYTCTVGTQVYLLATGGNPGLPAPQTNPNLALMANFGQCPASGSFAATIPTIQINEVTTIASVYAISGFMTDLTHVSSSGTSLAKTGIANAFATTNNLVNIATGTALTATPAGNGTVPQDTINTLANIIAACVYSTGASSAPCSTLFSTAVSGSTHPTDTVTAALNIAHNPGIGVSTLYAIGNSTPPFAPALPFAPHDFMLDLQFTGAGVRSENDRDNIAVDAIGNIWKANSFNSGSVSKFSNLGVPLSPSSGYSVSNISGDFAIDLTGNVWMYQNEAITQLDGSTGLTTYTGPSPIDRPTGAISVDGFNNVWGVSSTGVIKTDGSTHARTTFSGAAESPGSAIAVDGNNKVWVFGCLSGILTEFDAVSGTPLAPINSYAATQATGYTNISDCYMAIDGAENLWIASNTGVIPSSITKVNNVGVVLQNAALSTSSVYLDGVAVDGAGSIWTGDTPDGILRHVDGASGTIIPTSTSYYQGTFWGVNSGKLGIVAVDGSGNIWAPNLNTECINEFIGAATPVVTPIAAGVANHTLGTRP